MIKAEEAFDTRILRLSNYLNRAHKYNKPSILFALYLSEFLRTDIEKSLNALLKEQGLLVVSVDAEEHKDLPSFFSSLDSNNTVFFVHNLEKGFPEALQFLNFKREELVDNHVKVIFWVKEGELSSISLEAPDFFAFRNRVVEFMELPHTGELRPALVEFALETEYGSLDEIKRSIALKEKLLSELSTDTEITGYLLSSLGTLYFQIGLYEKTIEYNEKALKIAQETVNKQNEGSILGNLGLAYSDLGQVEKAIEYYGKARAIAREIGDRRNEGVWLGSLGNAHSLLGPVEKAIEYYKQARAIAREIGDRRSEGVWLGNLGSAYGDLGQVEKAIEYCEKALATAREIGDRHNEGVWLGNLGRAYRDLGQVEKAVEYYEQALTIAREIGDRRNEGVWLGNLGSAYGDLGQVEKEIEYCKNALEIGEEIKDPRIISSCEKKLESLDIT